MARYGNILALLIIYAHCWDVSADVVVIANHTDTAADFSIHSEREFIDVRLQPRVSRPYFTSGAITLTIGNSREAVGKRFPTMKLLPNCVYLLEQEQGQVVARRMNLGGDEATLKPNLETQQIKDVVVPVSLWVDDDQFATQSIWEPTLRARFEAAAEVIRQHSGVVFKVVQIGRWQSSNRIRVFSGSLYEFIDHVDPDGTLAIGFSSQYARPNKDGVLRIAGTRYPLDRHILVREWAGSTSEHERVELLVHELGHFLGACHSTDPASAMRSKLADHDSTTAEVPIRFDPANTLVMSLIGEHIRSVAGGITALSQLKQLSSQTQTRLRQIYSQLAVETPGDPVPTKYLMLLR